MLFHVMLSRLGSWATPHTRIEQRLKHGNLLDMGVLFKGTPIKTFASRWGVLVVDMMFTQVLGQNNKFITDAFPRSL